MMFKAFAASTMVIEGICYDLLGSEILYQLFSGIVASDLLGASAFEDPPGSSSIPAIANCSQELYQDIQDPPILIFFSNSLRKPASPSSVARTALKVCTYTGCTVATLVSYCPKRVTVI